MEDENLAVTVRACSYPYCWDFDLPGDDSCKFHGNAFQNNRKHPRFFQTLGIIDYLGIIISDENESVIILPLFPHETYFGIWISSETIVQKQLEAYDELTKIANEV